MTRTEQLKQLMKSHGLTPARVAELLERKPQTVRIWLCATEDSREIPKHSLELLRAKVTK